PLTLASPRAALWIWATASASSALLALWIIFREISIPLTPTTLIWTLIALLWAAPTGALLFSAQISWILWGPLALAWWAARNKRWFLLGVLLGAVTSVKPFLGLLLVSLGVRRLWKPALVAVTVTVLCYLSGAIVLGPSSFVVWLRAIGSVTW